MPRSSVVSSCWTVHHNNNAITRARHVCIRAWLTNVGAMFGKNLWSLPTRWKRKSKWPCSVKFLSTKLYARSWLFWRWIWHNVKTEKFSYVCTWETCVHSNAYFRPVCSELFPSFLLTGNFDLIKFCGTHVGPYSVGPLFGWTCSNIPQPDPDMYVYVTKYLQADLKGGWRPPGAGPHSFKWPEWTLAVALP